MSRWQLLAVSAPRSAPRHTLFGWRVTCCNSCFPKLLALASQTAYLTSHTVSIELRRTAVAFLNLSSTAHRRICVNPEDLLFNCNCFFSTHGRDASFGSLTLSSLCSVPLRCPTCLLVAGGLHGQPGKVQRAE